MKKWSNKKAEWLLVMLAVSLTASASWTITAEEKSEAIDRYIIVELETLTAPNVDAEEMELSSESEQSTEETVEVESEPEVVLFSLQDSLDSEEYSVTGISVDEPIIASFWNKQRTIRTMIPLPCMILLLISRQLMSHMTLISRFQRMRILHCIRQWMGSFRKVLWM